MNRRCIAILLLAMVGGCTYSDGPATRPANMRDRQQAALRDPMNYSPDAHRDISGGPINHLDKGAIKRDLDSVLNP